MADTIEQLTMLSRMTGQPVTLDLRFVGGPTITVSAANQTEAAPEP